MGDIVCLGDYLCFYCEPSSGYMFSVQTGTSHTEINTYYQQSKEKPLGIPTAHAITFKLCTRNRYKLNKAHQKLQNSTSAGQASRDITTQEKLSKAKLAAKAEDEDNEAEQKRQNGRRLRYGQVIQLQHMFSNRYVHVSGTFTSNKDKNNMMVFLEADNGKPAQFKILPRYKVKSEGDLVQETDQVILESVKSPGQYLHSSAPWALDETTAACEVNLGVHPSGFSIMRHYKPEIAHRNLVRGGSIVRLFHKELEAYLSAEGVFKERVTENVHLRLRPLVSSKPKSMYPPTSSITFWQIESEQTIVSGDVLRWEEQVRIRHMTTRHYLVVGASGRLELTEREDDPATVFRLLPVIKEAEEVQFETYTRVQHILTGNWLHAIKGKSHNREALSPGSTSAKAITWDGASLIQVGMATECMYDDAFTVQKVSIDTIRDFYYVSGMLPMVHQMITDVNNRKVITQKKARDIEMALTDVTSFLVVNGEPSKPRQKLVRNLRMIDLFVRYIQKNQDVSDTKTAKIITNIYELLRTYLLGDSRKNELYFAKYIDFFETQFHTQGVNGLKATQMITELIRDNRKIVDRIKPHDIDGMVRLVKEKRNHNYLSLLSVLCVCDGVAIPENQSYITKKWLCEDKGGVLLTELGDRINKDKGVMYVSQDNGTNWIPLHVFADLNDARVTEEEYKFLEEQLDLFGKLVWGRNEYAINVITKELGYLTWKEAFTCLTEEYLLHALRAKYCDLIIGLFIDVGNNRSILDQLNLSFNYAGLGRKGIRESTLATETMQIFPHLRDWIARFLDNNKDMTASEIGHNQLVEQVLRLLHHLVKFGYYGEERDIQELLQPLLNLLDGRNDKPYPKNKRATTIRLPGTDGGHEDPVAEYRLSGRYQKCPETKAVVDAKYRAMEVVELLMNLQFNQRLEKFLILFKHTEEKKSSSLNALTAGGAVRMGHKHQHTAVIKKAERELQTIIDSTAFFDAKQITDIFLDISNYQYEKMVVKSMQLLTKYYSAKTDLFTKAVQARVLLTPRSVDVEKMVERRISTLKELSRTKITDEHSSTVCTILANLSQICHMPNEPDERHPINQQILVNFDILSVVSNILGQGAAGEAMQGGMGMETEKTGLQKVLGANLELLRFLSKGNANVQEALFAHLSTLLEVTGVETQLALALCEVFTGNQKTCLKVHPHHIQKIVQLAAANREKAAEFVDLLCAIVKIEELNLPLKRNQGYVMKYVMQNYAKVAYVMDYDKEEKMNILRGRRGPEHLSYLISLVDLFASCAEGDRLYTSESDVYRQQILLYKDGPRAEGANRVNPYSAGTDFSRQNLPSVYGENRFIESLCQTILSIDEVLEILNDPSVENNLKRPYLRFLLWAYLNTAGGGLEADSGSLSTKCLPFFADLQRETVKLTAFVENNRENTALLLKKPPAKSAVVQTEEGHAFGTIHYYFDAVLQFIEVFCKKGPQLDRNPELNNIIKQLTVNLLEFSDKISPLISLDNQMKTLKRALVSMLSVVDVPQEISDRFVASAKSEELTQILNQAQKDYVGYYTQENEVNTRLNIFAVNFSLVYKGENTVAEQLKYPIKKEYTEIGGDEDLPLGREFQDLVACFYSQSGSGKNKYQLADKLIQQINISASRLKDIERNQPEQVELDIKCLQILRAMIHNKERLLPEGDTARVARKREALLDEVTAVQDALNSFGAITYAMPLIERRNDDIVREFLAFLAAMLYNANPSSQNALEHYFLFTREEMFFMAVKERIHMSVMATKERRSLLSQYEAKAAEAANQAKTLMATLTQKRGIMKEVEKQGDKMQKEVMLDNGNAKWSLMELKTLDRNERAAKKKRKKINDNADKTGDGAGDAVFGAVDSGEPEYKDEGYMELLLRVMAGMCDGQNKTIQDYLREQPDNFKSANLVGDVTTYLNLHYSHINEDNIDIVTQLFVTLNEFTSGNPTNHQIIHDNNIVDFVNFILRSNTYTNCSIDKILELQDIIGQLLLSMMEENNPDAAMLLQELQDTLDIESLENVATNNYQQAQKCSGSAKENYYSVGFKYFFLLQRLTDLADMAGTTTGLKSTKESETALRFYSINSKSIEIQKDKRLHRIYFRVKDLKILRDEVKEQLKWNIDRSSPSNKLREMMEWSKDIINDIYYQRKIQRNKVPALLIKFWNLWNTIIVLLSLIINVLMIAEYTPTSSLQQDEEYESATNLPDDIDNPNPVRGSWFDYVFYPLAGLHNLFSLILVVSFFLSSRPRLPTTEGIKQWMGRRSFGGLRKPPTKRYKRQSYLRIELFSFQVFYYVCFMLFSALGTRFYGYFFAFHLLNIVYNNQLLQRVIRAVTTNGESLLWVTVLGVIIIWIFSLASFAFLRHSMWPGGEESSLYCRSLAECMVSITRYGLIGDMFEKMQPVMPTRTFKSFALQSIFHLAFFIIITTIGLNIIFGIILDTFSELRTNKLTAENDMNGKCFICSKDAYEFESHAQGFDHHVKRDHNMWAYIFFFIHLKETSANDHTNLEMHVHKLIREEKLEYFPLNRALALRKRETDTQGNKLDHILNRLENIEKKQQRDDMQKEKKKTKQKQQEWETRHRQHQMMSEADQEDVQ